MSTSIVGTLCPLCGSKVNVVYGYLTVWVECTGAECFWTKTPDALSIKRAAVADWCAENPRPKPLIDHDYEEAECHEDCFAVVDEDEYTVSRCGRPESEHQASSEVSA